MFRKKAAAAIDWWIGEVYAHSAITKVIEVITYAVCATPVVTTCCML